MRLVPRLESPLGVGHAVIVRRALAWCTVILGFTLVAAESQAADPALAKADIVCNIAKFVTWPASALGPATSPLVVTIVGEDELAIALATQLSAKSVSGRSVFVRFARRAKDVRGSHLVYVAGSEAAKVPEVLVELAGQPALTVADVDGFASHGGMVSFTQEQGRTRFQIHVKRAEAAGLKVSSRLLSLAQVVSETP